MLLFFDRTAQIFIYKLKYLMDVKKYDRQLRLWHKHGQEALESSSICIIGSNNLSTETMKNLVLPGVGAFTVVDDKIVDETDIGSNFFLLQSSLGKSRAEVSMALLNELNSQVKGSFLHQVNPPLILES